MEIYTNSFRQITTSQLINFSVMAFTYLRFHAALKSQQVGRGSLPYQSWGQLVAPTTRSQAV